MVEWSTEMKTLGDYEYGSKILGSGAFSLVYEGRVKDRPNERVAIKIMNKDTNMPKNRTLLSKEISVLKDLDHKNIVRLFHHGVHDNIPYLIMEFCNGGDLSEYLQIKKTLSEDTIRHFLSQIGSAMYAINRKGFMHRDLKPGNILLTYPPEAGRTIKDVPGHVLTFKLADFGFARWLQDGMMAVTMCGSPMYMAPEVLMCREYDARADIWSLGVIIYQCLTGTAPFCARNPEELKNIYRNPNLRPQIPPTTSDALRHLLLQMLIREPRDRIDFARFLKHRFLHPERQGPITLSRPGLKGQGPSLGGNGGRKDPTSFVPCPPVGNNAPATLPGRQPSRKEPFYLDPQKPTTIRDRTPQGMPTNMSKAPYATPQIPQDTHSPIKIAAYREQPLIPQLDNLDDLDDEMSRTTVDDYIEDELDSSALLLEPALYTFRPLGPQPQVAPPVPSRGSSVSRMPGVNHNLPSNINQLRNVPFSLRPMGELEPEETNLDGFIIVGANGSVDPGPRTTRPPSVTGNYPVSNIGRIVANPMAYLNSQPRIPATLSPLAQPDVPTTVPAGRRNPTAIQSHQTGAPPRFEAQQMPTRPSPTAPENAVLTNSGEYEVTTERVRLRPHSGGGILDYGPEGPIGLAPGAWVAPESSEEHMDAKHNEEIKTITMVLELCELLSELAQRRASVLADCAVTTTASGSSTAAPADSPEVSEGAAGAPQTATSNDSSTTPGGTTGLKFLSEDQRIVEQIVLYRRVLYYLEYVFVQVKKAFHHGQLRSTPISRARLNDCYRLYQVCFVRLRELARQSRRDDLIEPVGRLLAKITANRLIFQYALLQCQAAEMDAYVGEVAQAFQRYKAAITLIHGLRQHAKTDNDKVLLAECMRLLQDRYNSLRVMAAKTQYNIGCFGHNSSVPTEFAGSGPGFDNSPASRAPTASLNPVHPELDGSSTS